MQTHPQTVFSPSLVERVGDIGKVLGEFLDTQTLLIQQAMQQTFPGTPPDAVRRVLGAFITLEGTKRPLGKAQVRIPLLGEAQLDFCIGRLETARILRLEDGLYELAHDTLALKIAEQRSVEEVSFLEAVKLVKDSHRLFPVTQSLLNANELMLVTKFRARLVEEESLSADEWAFVQRSDRENRRRRLTFLAVVTGVMITLAAFAGFSYVQWELTKKQRTVAEKARTEAEENLRRLAEEQAQKAEAQYHEHLERGRGLMAQSNYLEAIQEFETALVFREDGDEARSLKTEAESRAGVKQRFERLIADGDNYYKLGPPGYVDALDHYRRARTLNYNNSLADGKINSLSGLLESAYQKFKKDGDTFFRAGAYPYALDNYRQALRIRPGDEAIRRQLEACRQRLGQ